ncbi:axoneme-associated protein mst101(2) [Penaeus vannamei]|uniref:axoneme-associated protein mst101(2) n=1 Tax=Penaeus vannamei TaxID=6689 RepID=UPI00387F606F
MAAPGRATAAALLLLLAVASQGLTSKDGGRPSSPDGILQGHAAAISLAGAPLVAKGERRPDLQVRKASDEHPRPLKTSLYGAGSLQRPRVGRTSDGKRSVKGNTKTARESRIVRKADGARQKLPSGESESSKKRKQKRKDKRARTKERQQKRRNKGNKKTRKNGKSKKASPQKKKVKKGNSQRSNRNKNKKAREPKEEKQKKNNKNSHKKKIVKSSTKKLEGEIRQISDGNCDVSTKVGKGEVVAVESRATSEAVDCKHKIRASKGATLKMTCPRFSLSPSRCKEEKVVIKEIGKGNFKKKYCKGKIPGEEVSDAALKAVTLLHRRAKLKGKQCAVGFLCLFSTSEISSKVSECRGKYKLQEGESMIVAPSTFRDKVSCKYTFKSPKGTTLALSCPSFNLSERGCGRERVIVREKKAKYKKKFCKTSNPAKERSQTTSNHFTITHKRKKLKDKECERGFWCQVSVVKGKPVTAKPTVEQPVTAEPTVEQPVTAEPTVDQAVTEKSTTGPPITNKPLTGQESTATASQPTISQTRGVTTTIPISQGTMTVTLS